MRIRTVVPIILWTFLLGFPHGGARAQSSLTNGLEAYYLFDGNTLDSSGNGNNGTNINGATYTSDRFGNANGAIYLDDQIVTTGFFPPLGTTNRTVTGWFNVASSASEMALLSYGSPNAGGLGNRFEVSINNGVFTLDVANGSLWTQNTYDDSNWHQFVLVVPPGGGVLSNVVVYLDGEEQTNLSYYNMVQVVNTVGTDPLEFGQTVIGVGQRPLIGALDDVRVYNRALSALEAVELYVDESGNSNLPPVIVQEPLSVTTTNGGKATFTVATFSDYPVTYQWQLNGTNLNDVGEFSGSATNVLVVDPATTTDVGSYTVIVNNQFGGTTSSAATLTIWTNPPVITAQPAGLTVTNQGLANITVGASYALGFQWRFNGAILIDGGEILGSKSTNLMINPASFGDIGSYTVVVTNAFGSTTSSVAALTIWTNPPTITVEPQSLTVSNLGLASFSVTATNFYRLSYQWQKNGTNLTEGGEISGSGSSNLTINPAGAGDVANYTVIVTNVYGSVTSTVATLTVVTVSELTNGLLAYYTFNGNTLDASGNGNNGTNFGGTYVPDRFGLANEAIYLATNTVSTGFFPPLAKAPRTFTGWFNAAPNSGAMTLLCCGSPSSAQQIQLEIIPAGQFQVSFAGGAAATTVGTYNDANWHQFVVSIPTNAAVSNTAVYLDSAAQSNLTFSAPADIISIGNSHALQFGEYFVLGSTLPLVGGLDDVRVYNRALAPIEAQLLYQLETSAPDAAPAIVQQPHSVTVTNGAATNFSIQITGYAPFSYQWQRSGTNLPNGGDISGATTSNLTFGAAAPQDQGNYTVIATNSYGSVTSSVAALIVRQAFSWPTLLSPELANVPFTVTVQARNATNGIATNFTGTVALASTNGIAVSPANSAAFVNGAWTGKVRVSKAVTNLVLTATDSQGDTASANAINVVSPPLLGEYLSDDVVLMVWPVITPATASLQSTTNLMLTNWTVVADTPVQIGSEYVVPIEASEAHRFYRLVFSAP